MISKRMCTTMLTFAGVALLSGVTAVAQAGAGQSPSQPQPTFPSGSTPNGTTPSGTRPDMTDQSNSSMDHTMNDKAFVKKALEGGMAEVQLGQLALQKSQNDQVKQFAQKMIDDHTQMGDQMKQVAAKIDVKVPTAPSKKDKAVMMKLQALSGKDFDQAYIKDMVKDHQQDEKDFKEESQMATIPEVKQAATQGEQIISQHLHMIEDIAQQNGVTASK